MFCAFCGKALTPGGRFCAGCGKAVAPPAVLPQQPPPPIPPVSKQSDGIQQPPTNIAAPAVPVPLSPSAKEALLEQYTRAWKRADWMKYIPLPRWAAMSYGISLNQTKADLKKKVAGLGIDAEEWEKPLRAASTMNFCCIMAILVIGWVGWMTIYRASKP